MTRINFPLKVYNKLYKSFGPQGWWPVTKTDEGKDKEARKPEYFPLSYKRDTEEEKFEICVGAILTQNTAWKNVEKALYNLNLNKALNINKVSSIKTEHLSELIRPSGYYNQKTIRLKIFASYIQNEYGGKIANFFNKKTDVLRKELLKIYGIGPETADSMLLYAANKPVFVVDAYSVRIGSRIGWFSSLRGRNQKNYENIQSCFYKALPRSLKIYNEFHALLVELGKNYCRKKPLCSNCPVKSLCRHFKEK